jgi:hypothetical protein
MDRLPGVVLDNLTDANALTILPKGHHRSARASRILLTDGEVPDQKTVGSVHQEVVRSIHQKVVGSMVIATVIIVIITAIKSVTITPIMMASGLTITTITIIGPPMTTHMSAGASNATGHIIRVPIATSVTMENTIAA